MRMSASSISPRNLGHQLAITAGIEHGTGDAVVIMDTDVQDPPAVSLELVAAWERGADVVYAQRRKREDRRSSVVPPMNRTGRARLIGVIRCQPS